MTIDKEAAPFFGEIREGLRVGDQIGRHINLRANMDYGGAITSTPRPRLPMWKIVISFRHDRSRGPSEFPSNVEITDRCSKQDTINVTRCI